MDLEITETKYANTASTMTLDRKEDDDDNDYDPFEHRNVTHPTSTIGSFFHLLKSSLGAGLLAMPMAFKHAGVIPGCIGTILVAVLATHCVHILVDTSRAVCRKIKEPSLSYTDTCEKVFQIGPQRLQRYSKAVRYFADATMAGVCLGGTAVYVMFLATTLKDVFDYFVPENKLSLEVYCGILLLPLILTTQIRYLKFLVPFSMLANVCLVLTVGITCYYTFAGVLEDSVKIELVSDVVQWPLFFSTAIFAMEGINVVMPVENEMARPQRFLGCPGVLTSTMGFVAALYGIVGLFGYLKYGENVEKLIILNFPQNDILGLTAKFLVVVAVTFTYCLQMYAPMDIIWTRVKHRVIKKYHNVGQVALRTISVTATVVLAAAIPDVKLLISLVSAIFFSTLGLLIPLVVQTVFKWERGLGRWNYILWKNGLLVIVYLIVLVSGCYSAIAEIVERFQRKA